LVALFRFFYDSNPPPSALSNQSLANPHNRSRQYRRLNYESAVLSLVFPLVNYNNWKKIACKNYIKYGITNGRVLLNSDHR